MANEGAMVTAIIKNPGAWREFHVHLVSHFKLQSHAVGCCFMAVSSWMIVRSNHLHSILHQVQPHSCS